PAKAVEAAALSGRSTPSGAVQLDHDRYGAGYGAMTDECRDALDLAARLEGLILDPVYTGKALAGLIASRGDGRIERDTRTVFVHTGGTPALFAAAYADWISSPPASSPPASSLPSGP